MPTKIQAILACSKKNGQVIKNALYSVLLISINEDEEIKKFWENEVLERLTTIVKAA